MSGTLERKKHGYPNTSNVKPSLEQREFFKVAICKFFEVNRLAKHKNTVQEKYQDHTK